MLYHHNITFSPTKSNQITKNSLMHKFRLGVKKYFNMKLRCPRVNYRNKFIHRGWFFHAPRRVANNVSACSQRKKILTFTIYTDKYCVLHGLSAGSKIRKRRKLNKIAPARAQEKRTTKNLTRAERTRTTRETQGRRNPTRNNDKKHNTTETKKNRRRKNCF